MAEYPVTLPDAPPADMPRSALRESIVDENPVDDDGFFNEPVPVRISAVMLRYRARKDNGLIARRFARQGDRVDIEHVDDLVSAVRGRAVVGPDDLVPGEFLVVDGPTPDPDEATNAALLAASAVGDPNTIDPDLDPDTVVPPDGDDLTDFEPVENLTLDDVDPALLDIVRNKNVQEIVMEAGDSGPQAQALLSIERLVAAESDRPVRTTLERDLTRLIRAAEDDLLDPDDDPDLDD